MSFIKIPPDIKQYREQLCNPGSTNTSWPPEKFLAYWPFVDKIWQVDGKKSVVVEKSGESRTTRNYHCRFHQVEARASQAKGMRKRVIAEPLETPCGMKVKVANIVPPKERMREASYYMFWRTSECDKHSHSIEAADAKKTNSGLWQQVVNIANDGWLLDEIERNLFCKHDEVSRARLMDAGGAKITRQDIWNWLKKGTKLDKSATTAWGRRELLAKASAANGVDPSFMTDGPGEHISSQTHIGEQLEAAAEQAP